MPNSRSIRAAVRVEVEAGAIRMVRSGLSALVRMWDTEVA